MRLFGSVNTGMMVKLFFLLMLLQAAPCSGGSVQGTFFNSPFAVLPVPSAVICFFAGLVIGILFSIFIPLLLKRKQGRVSEEQRKKIEREEEERVRKIIIAQLYCDIKTQIQKHEWRRIEKEVRSELYESAKKKLQEKE